MGKETVTQILEVQRIPYRLNLSRNTLKNIIIKFAKKKKIKDRDNTKSNTGKLANNITLWILINLSDDFSAKTLQDRKELHRLFKVMKRKNL